MKLKGIVVPVLSYLLLYAPINPLLASSPAAKMITTGTAEINGTAAPAVTSAFVGDLITTEKAATTSLNFAGGDAVVMPELTKASLGEKAGSIVVNLQEGTLSVLNKTSKPIIVQAHGARIVAAANSPALYEVTLHGDALRVVARGGTARVETANRTGEAKPGSELDARLAPDPPDPVSGLNSTQAWTWVGVGLGATGAALGAVSLAKVNNCHLSASTNKVVC